LKRVGMWGPKIQETFVEMGVIDFADLDSDAIMSDDQHVAEELERLLAAQRERGQLDLSDATSRAGEVAATIAAAEG
ncbi:MAG: hypothetical protein ACRDY7_15190, partial [Acidimicrobiia bacterium]